MTPGDLNYLRFLISAGVVSGPVLEVGSYAWQGSDGNCQATCLGLGLEWEGADIEEGPGVSFQLDILDSAAVREIAPRWGTVLVFNLLEHIYDPILALRNAVTLAGDADVVVLSPLVWEIHNYPGDFWRPLPGFYDEFAVRNDLIVNEGASFYITNEHLIPRATTRDTATGEDRIPSKGNYARYLGRPRARYSDAINRLFGTAGRSMHYPYVAYATVLCRKMDDAAGFQWRTTR